VVRRTAKFRVAQGSARSVRITATAISPAARAANSPLSMSWNGQ
jgi:hypothetical protein